MTLYNGIKFTWYEKLICIVLPICCAMDAFFTYAFSSRDDVIYREFNAGFKEMVAQNVSPGFVMLHIMIVSFISIVIMFYILRNREKKGYQLYGAYHIWIVSCIVLCFTRPLSGLTWYFKSEAYNELMMDVMVSTTALLFIMIMLLILGSLFGKPRQNDKLLEKSEEPNRIDKSI
jgi:hypothetical protein